MELSDVIKRRRTIRDFLNKEIPEGVILKSIENGFKAPTYNHLKEWNYLVITDNKIKQLLTETEEMVESISKEIKSNFQGCDETAKTMYFEAIPKQKRMIVEAPVVIAVVFKQKTEISKATRIYDLNCLASVWCSIENVLLSLAEDDVYGVTFIPKNTDKVKTVLKIPQELEVAALIPIGYKAHSVKEIVQKEINVKEKIHFNQW